MKKDTKLQANDAKHFRKLMADVRPLRHDKVHHSRPKPPPHPQQTEQDEARVMEELLHHPLDPLEIQDGDTMSFSRPGLRKTVLRKLRRGQYTIAAELDLHGMNTAAAELALQEFLQAARESNARCVRIIHGKGNRSSNRGPVLKPLVNRWLRRRDEVLAFSSARPIDGGTGAVYVLLRGR